MAVEGNAWQDAASEQEHEEEPGEVVPLFACNGCGRSYPGPRRRGRCPACARAYERSKGSSSQRGYTQKHKRLAARVIAAHPWCVDCRSTEDLCADHIVPLSRGGTNTLDNYSVRCRSCNSARANVERRRQAGTPGGGRRCITRQHLGDPTPTFRESHSRLVSGSRGRCSSKTRGACLRPS